jgi:integrase
VESQRSPMLPDVVVASLCAHFARQDEERIFAGSDWVDTGMVFTTTKGTMLDARNMLREYYKLRDLAELPKIRFHGSVANGA